MRNSVRQAFVGFTEPFESVLTFMYLDVKGLVTTAMGNLIDPISMALTLPWVRPDGSFATRDEVASEWNRVKARTDLEEEGGGIFAGLTRLRLTKEGVTRVVNWRLDQNEAILHDRFIDFDIWPADAQLFAHSMAWACGAEFRYPKLVALLNDGDFREAVNECTINPQRGTIILRNAENRTLLRNAAFVREHDYNPDTLYWPHDLDFSERPTDPEITADCLDGDSEPPPAA